jgi:8-oxo-dGTP diphosphatase
MTGSYTYPFPAHYITTDIVAFTFKATQLQVLLIERGQSPFKGSWALPGGFMKPDEELDACARRELAEETSLKTFFLEQFTTVGTIGRDPRGRVITVAHLGLVRWEDQVRGGTDASDARWFPIDELPRLAFDHGELIKLARLRLERMLVEQPMLLLRFLPEEFTIEQMQAVQGAVLARSPERRSFYGRATTPPAVALRAMTIPPKKRR